MVTHFVFAQNELAFEKGVIYLQSNDSLRGFVELAVTYGKSVYSNSKTMIKRRALQALQLKQSKRHTIISKIFM